MAGGLGGLSALLKRASGGRCDKEWERVEMMPVTEWQVWWSKEIADVALSDPAAALEVIGPPARYLDGTYLVWPATCWR